MDLQYFGGGFNNMKIQKCWKWTCNILVGRGMPSFWFKTGISASENFMTLCTGPLSVIGQSRERHIFNTCKKKLN